MQKKPQITLHNIFSFIEGNTKMFLGNMNLQPKHIQEQIAYRMLICSDCMSTGHCKVCGCDVPGKLYVTESCNKGERFPDLMNRVEWDKYKKENDIK